MDKNATRARWQVVRSQAEQLAAKDHTVDALARARLTLAEARRMLAQASPSDRGWLEEDVFLWEREVERFQQLHTAWQATVEARRAKAESRERAVYDAPLPVPAGRW